MTNFGITNFGDIANMDDDNINNNSLFDTTTLYIYTEENKWNWIRILEDNIYGLEVQ